MSKKLECIIRSYDDEMARSLKSDQMIKEWLEKNEPSVKIEHNKPMPHITPNGSIGSKHE